MVSHVNIPINIYILYENACSFLLDFKYDLMNDALEQLNKIKPEDFDCSKYVIVDINDWQEVFNASVACWMGEKEVSRITLEKTISSINKIIH